MSFDVFIGFQGRMSLELQKLYQEKPKDFKLFGPDVPEESGVKNFENAGGVIDFSTPDATAQIVQLAQTARTALVCGTTGWKSSLERNELFKPAAKDIAMVVDSNFSLGIEVLCQSTEQMVRAIDAPLLITDIHHKHKKDSPSGTAIKLKERIQKIRPDAKIEIKDIRTGEVPGEHRVAIAWGQETLEFTHIANSRQAFAEGAVLALEWAKKQKPGLYSMKDVFDDI